MSYADRLESILKNKIDILERIYDCDDRIRSATDPVNSELQTLDSYLIDMDGLMNELDESDRETGEIIEYLEAHSEEINKIPNVQCDRIRGLLKEVEGKTEAVREIEDQVKKITESLIKNKREGIRTYRKQSRVVKGYYMPQRTMVSEDMVIFDTKN